MSPTTTSWIESADSETERVDGEQIYCLKCGAAKLHKETVLGKEYVIKVGCPCDDELRKAAEESAKSDAKQQRILTLKLNSGLGKRYANATFSTTSRNQDPEFASSITECVKYCANAADALYKGKGLYLYGTSGVGKTWLAACICNELTDIGYSVIFTSFCEISRQIRETYSTNQSENTIFKRLLDVDFLIIDDIGTEIVQKNNSDNWLQERIYDIINSRYVEQKPMIYTSNLAIKQLVTLKGLMQKTADRIYESSSAVIAVQNRNWRTGG